MLPGRRDERGIVLPAAALVGSIVAVAVAAVGFVLTAQPGAPATPAATAPQSPTATPLPPMKRHVPAHPLKPKVQRDTVNVVVFNNSNVTGLAGSTAARAQDLGWQVIGTDNWYGTIGAPTVYYPQRLHAAADLLARDLGIGRVKPAMAPMQMDRLTVILTAAYQP